MLEFETNSSRLLSVIPNIPPLILALQLLKSVNIDEMQRRSILSHVKFDISNENVYEDLKSAIRLLKGTLVEKSKKTADEEAFYGDNRKFYRGRYDHRDRGRSEFRDRDRQRNNSNSRERNSRNYRDRNNVDKYKKDSTQRRSNSRDRNERSSQRNSSANRSKKVLHSQEEEINMCYDEKDVEDKIDDVFISISCEGFVMILDCGTTKTVAGLTWMDNFLASLPDNIRKHIKIKEDKRKFKF